MSSIRWTFSRNIRWTFGRNMKCTDGCPKSSARELLPILLASSTHQLAYMLRFSANLSFLFTEIPFADRFAAAAASGFRGVEFIDFGGLPRQQIADLLESHSLKLVMFNTALGDWGKGDRGIAAIAGREAECRSVVFQAIDQAADLKCGLLHLMSGLRSRGAR